MSRQQQTIVRDNKINAKESCRRYSPMQMSFDLIQLGTTVASLLFIVYGKDIRLGVLLPITGSWSVGSGIIPTIDIAIEHIESQPNLLKGYNIAYVTQNSNCSVLEAVGRTADLLQSQPQIDVFIGPGCSRACLSAASLANYYNKPMISYSCSSIDLEDRVLYSTFSRTQPFSRTYSEKTPALLVILMQHFGWRRAAILAAKDEIWDPMAQKLRAEMQRQDMVVAYFHLYNNADKEASFPQMLEQVKRHARIVFIIADRTDVAMLILQAREQGMLGGDYAIITLDFYLTKKIYQETWSLKRNEMKKLCSGLINLVVKKPIPAERKNLTDEIQARLDKEPGNITLSSSANVTAPYLYDAILLYAHALNHTLLEGQNMSDGKSVFKSVVSNFTMFNGLTEPVSINSKGSRVPTFVFENKLENHNVPLFEVWLLKNKVVNSTAVAVWPGGSTRVPDDDPECMFHKGPSCRETRAKHLWLVPTVVSVALLVILTFAFVYYKKKRFEKDLMNGLWIIDYNQIYLCALGNRFASRVIRNRSLTAVALKTSQLEINNSVPLGIDIGKYKGELVAIKRVRKDCISLSRDLLIEMKQVRDLSNQNLVPYVGVCVQPPNICILSQYCYRGSLEDILAADDIKLDWFFRVSFANDITMGMAALHANHPMLCHGRLRSSKCLIDSRWACKVSDYGMNLFRRKQRPKAESRHAMYKRLFWTAPELLLTEDCTGTQAGDVYSFGIIMYELLTRDEPYSNIDPAMDPEEIVQRVKKRMKPIFRPEISDCIEQELLKPVDLMRKCWHDLPSARPSFNEVKTMMKHMHSARNTNIVDNMLRMMETYTDQLEDLVDQRTKQLAEEKAKTDELLCKMLPRPVAEELKMGRAVPAESFAKVTIFFSDIVGFTKLAAESSPLQVVDFLNDLYTCFDKIIDAHDVYKVETIGDAYMVVSGLPVPNGKRHAAEIATMALHLLSSTTDFQIRHLPNLQLQLRIGIHSGPCVAGVVGLKMPRYCLFGDTVNYASRMESSGIALRIHVSPECKELLEELGNFQLEERGPVSMKGKGTIVTYFLNGMEGFTKRLPDFRQAASLD